MTSISEIRKQLSPTHVIEQHVNVVFVLLVPFAVIKTIIVKIDKFLPNHVYETRSLPWKSSLLSNLSRSKANMA